MAASRRCASRDWPPRTLLLLLLLFFPPFFSLLLSAPDTRLIPAINFFLPNSLRRLLPQAIVTDPCAFPISFQPHNGRAKKTGAYFIFSSLAHPFYK